MPDRSRAPRALDAVNAMVVRDLTKVRPGRVAYGPVVDDHGGMIDDSTCMVFGLDHVRVTGGGALPDAVEDCLSGVAGLTVDTFRSRVFQLNVQGPRSRDLLRPLTAVDLSNESFPYYTFQDGAEVAGVPCFLARMGFTGELGWELWGPVERALELWDALVVAGERGGIDVVGVGAVTVLTVRTEAGMIMGDGLDYGASTSPWECGLGWTVSDTKRGYRGCGAVLAAKDTAGRRLVTVRTDTEIAGDATKSPLHIDGQEVGCLNLPVSSPLAGSTLAMATVHRDHAAVGTRLIAEFDGAEYPGEIVATPQYDPDRHRVRA